MSSKDLKTGLLQLHTEYDVGDAEDNYNFTEGFFETKLDHEAPIPVCDCIAFLKTKALDQQGLFRTPGNLLKVKEIIKVYNKQYKKKVYKKDPHYSVLNEFYDPVRPNDVASLLKKFFNDLEEPLIPEKYKGVMMFIMKAEMPQEEKQRELVEVLKQMPSPNKEVAGYVVSFLRELAQHEENTKMDAKNLGMCLAVCFFRGKSSGEQLMLSTFGTLILEALITCNIGLPMPKEVLINKNTLFDEFFVQVKPVKRGSSIFGSFRSSTIMKNLIGPSGGSVKTPTNTMRSILEDVEIEEEKKKTEEVETSLIKSNQRNSKDNALGEVTNVKDSSSQGSHEPKEKPMKKSRGRKRGNSFIPTSNNSKILIEIFGVKDSETLLELKEKNKKGIVLPPDTSSMTRKEKKRAFKNARKASNASAVSSMQTSTAPITPTLIRSKSKVKGIVAYTHNVEKKHKQVDTMEAEASEEEDISSRLDMTKVGQTTRESFKGMRFSSEEAKELRKINKSKKRRKKRSVSTVEEVSQTNNEHNLTKRKLPPTPKRRPVVSKEAVADPEVKVEVEHVVDASSEKCPEEMSITPKEAVADAEIKVEAEVEVEHVVDAASERTTEEMSTTLTLSGKTLHKEDVPQHVGKSSSATETALEEVKPPPVVDIAEDGRFSIDKEI